MNEKHDAVKLVGPVAWAKVADTADGEVTRAILGGNNELAVDLVCEGYRYSVKLKKTVGSHYDGSWSCTAEGTTYTDSVSGTLYPSSNGYFIIGKWREDGVSYYWWAELSKGCALPGRGRCLTTCSS